MYSMDTVGIYGNGEYRVKIVVVDVQKGITDERKCLLEEIWHTIADLRRTISGLGTAQQPLL